MIVMDATAGVDREASITTSCQALVRDALFLNGKSGFKKLLIVFLRVENLV